MEFNVDYYLCSLMELEYQFKDLRDNSPEAIQNYNLEKERIEKEMVEKHLEVMTKEQIILEALNKCNALNILENTFRILRPYKFSSEEIEDVFYTEY